MTMHQVASCFPSFSHYVHRRGLALRIREINMSFESIDKKATKLGLVRGLADSSAALEYAASDQTNSVSIDPIFIGRHDDVSKVVEMLITTPTEKTLSILPIVGMGGMGKTTLVRNVFNHEKTKTCFELHIWVHVSPIFEVVALLKKILIVLNPEVDNGVENMEVDNGVENMEVLAKKLREKIGGKSYLLVLDDVWNKDRQKWEDFINTWSGITSTKRNGILVTTRNIEVGSIVNTIGIHQLNGLSEEDCWSIIKDKSFKGEDIPPGFEDIGRSIAKRCQGLPLAASVVGGMLQNKSHDEWLLIKENWLSDVGGDENNISKILRLSYDHLSSPSIKKCFAYCSIFPKGSRIDREDLIQLWMAEGFLQSSPPSDMEDVGNKLVHILVQSSLLQVLDRDEYSMHDLVHDVASSVLGLPKVNDNISNGTNQARYLSWLSQGDESSRFPKSLTKWVRSLFYDGEISDVVFSDFKSLHVLVLSGDFHELPDSICELIHLRLLNISDTRVGELPNSIGELYHLQTFKAYNLHFVVFPSTFKYLLNLRHLNVLNGVILPRDMGMLTSLQTIPSYIVHNEEGYRIEELGSLKNLKGRLEIVNLEKVCGEDESNKACLLQKSGIVRLVLRWDDRREGEINDENVLKGLQPNQTLKILEISGFKGASFPSWTLEMEGFSSLMRIRLEKCVECEEIPMLGRLPRLKSLHLSHLNNVKSISSSFYSCSSINKDFKETIYVFPALERLELLDMPNLTEWVQVEPSSGVEVKVFPRLEYLKIEACKQLRSVPSHFPCLKVLKIDEMDSGIPLATICGIKLTSLVQLEIRRIGQMVCLPDWLFHNNQNLKVLEIELCEEMRELPQGLQTLNSLERLWILNCNSLESIPISSRGGFTSLRGLVISTKSVMNVPSDMVESCASSLEWWKLSGNVTDMTMLIERIHKMARLKVLYLDSVPKFMISSPKGLGSMRSLEILRFIPDGSWDCVSFIKAADEILRLGSPSLQTIELRGEEDWEYLPDQLQHLTALEELVLHSFGAEELPEWFGNLLSLRKLTLINCKNLKRLPSADAMRRLTNLTILDIHDCPLLKERFIKQQNDHEDSEWPKISQIQDTRIDYNPIHYACRRV